MCCIAAVAARRGWRGVLRTDVFNCFYCKSFIFINRRCCLWGGGDAERVMCCWERYLFHRGFAFVGEIFFVVGSDD